MCDQLAEHLPRSSDPDMALNNLERFVAAARNPLSLGTLFERDREALPTLLQIFATSQHLSDLLVTDRESFDLLRLTEGQPVARRGAGRRAGGRGRGAGDDEAAVLRGAAAVQAPRDAADRLRRHRSRASRWRPSPRRFRTWPTRLSKRPCGRRGGSSMASRGDAAAARRRRRRGSSCWRWASSAAWS